MYDFISNQQGEPASQTGATNDDTTNQVLHSDGTNQENLASRSAAQIESANLSSNHLDTNQSAQSCDNQRQQSSLASLDILQPQRTQNQTTDAPTALSSRANSISSRPSCADLASIHSLHPQLDLKLNPRFMLMPINDQIRELQTVIRDKETSRGEFKFFADRLIRLVVEEGLNRLPIERVDVNTPTGSVFHGIRYLKGNCGVSIVRSGESMEQGLRDCCRSSRIGKILIESDENYRARVLYAKFPPDIAGRGRVDR